MISHAVEVEQNTVTPVPNLTKSQRISRCQSRAAFVLHSITIFLRTYFEELPQLVLRVANCHLYDSDALKPRRASLSPEQSTPRILNNYLKPSCLRCLACPPLEVPHIAR